MLQVTDKYSSVLWRMKEENKQKTSKKTGMPDSEFFELIKLSLQINSKSCVLKFAYQYSPSLEKPHGFKKTQNPDRSRVRVQCV